MPFRDTSAVCAHCQQGGAGETCSGCGRVVCDGCARRWLSCPTPSARSLRLGLGRRLRSVDARGRHGLVSTATMRLKLLDIESGEQHRRSLGSHRVVSPQPLLLGSQVAWLTFNYGGGYLRGIGVAELPDDPADLRGLMRERRGRLVPVRSDYQPPSRFIKSADDSLVALQRYDERVDVLDLAAGERRATLYQPGAAVQTIAIDAAQDLALLAFWERVVAFSISDQKRVNDFAGGRRGVAWIATAADRAVFLTTRVEAELSWLFNVAARGLVAVENIGTSSRTPLRRQIATVGTPRRRVAAGLSRDGRLVAIGNGYVRGGGTMRSPLLLVDLDSERAEQLAGHSGTVVFVTFVEIDGREVLISADDDNRVILWPRDGDWVRPLADAPSR